MTDIGKSTDSDLGAPPPPATLALADYAVQTVTAERESTEAELRRVPFWRFRRRAHLEARLERRMRREQTILSLKEGRAVRVPERPVSLKESRAVRLITDIVRLLQAELPAFVNLTLVMRLDLTEGREEGTSWRVALPGPRIGRGDLAADARMAFSLPRDTFERLAGERSLEAWVAAVADGTVEVSGDPAVAQLLGDLVANGRRAERV